MTATLKWKLLLGFVLVFLAGGATGNFVAAYRAHSSRADLRHSHSLGERFRNRMQARLDLTPEQTARAAPIFDQTARKLENIRAETNQRVREVLAESDRQLAPILTAEQQAKLEAAQKQRHQLRAERKPPRLPDAAPAP